MDINLRDNQKLCTLLAFIFKTNYILIGMIGVSQQSLKRFFFQIGVFIKY